MTEELRAAHESKARQESQFAEETSSLLSEISTLRSTQSSLEKQLLSEKERTADLERELAQIKTHYEKDLGGKRVVEDRNANLFEEMTKARSEMDRAIGEAADRTREADLLRQELNQVRADFEQVKALEKKNADMIEGLLAEQEKNLRVMEEARARGEDLEQQIQAARMDGKDVQLALKAASAEKDRLLKVQAAEHERIMRDHRAEAAGDRAVLDRRFAQLQSSVDKYEKELALLRSELEISNADASGLREELQRVERELREARGVEELLRDDLRAGRASRTGFERKVEDGDRLVAGLLEVAICFRNSHVKALQAAVGMAVPPGGAERGGRQGGGANAAGGGSGAGGAGVNGTGGGNLAESIYATSAFRAQTGLMTIGSLNSNSDLEPPPIDPSDPSTALEVLREWDHDSFLEAISKIGGVIRKWKNQCREYRERAKGKISFRNFARGDLALFLPTRNSVAKPWAAFNGELLHFVEWS